MKLVSPEKRFNFSFKFIGKFVLFPVVMLLVFSFQYSATADTEKEEKNILILLPDERGEHTQTLIEKGIRSAIDTATEFRIVYYVKFMDLNRFGGPTHYQLLLDLYRHKYSVKEIHLVIPYGNTKIIVDAGIQYLAAHKDDEGRWLDGANTYELLVPPDVPMLYIWSVVLYDNDSRAMIVNPQDKPEINSRMEMAKGDDGSVTLTFSWKIPDGVPESNWIQTNPEKGFFAYFRWYSPTKAFFDRSWKMENIKEVK